MKNKTDNDNKTIILLSRYLGLIIATATITYGLLDTFRIVPLKEQIGFLKESYEAEIKVKEIEINRKKDIIADLENKMKKPYDKVIKVNAKIAIDNSRIITKINNQIQIADSIIKLDYKRNEAFDKYDDWRNHSINLINSIQFSLKDEYLKDYTDTTFLKRADYSLIPLRTKYGKFILEKIKDILIH
jgi:hypothetical protein